MKTKDSWVNAVFEQSSHIMFPRQRRKPIFHRVEMTINFKGTPERRPLGQWIRHTPDPSIPKSVVFYDCVSKKFFPGPINDPESLGYGAEADMRVRGRRAR